MAAASRPACMHVPPHALAVPGTAWCGAAGGGCKMPRAHSPRKTQEAQLGAPAANASPKYGTSAAAAAAAEKDLSEALTTWHNVAGPLRRRVREAAAQLVSSANAAGPDDGGSGGDGGSGWGAQMSRARDGAHVAASARRLLQLMERTEQCELEAAAAADTLVTAALELRGVRDARGRERDAAARQDLAKTKLRLRLRPAGQEEDDGGGGEWLCPGVSAWAPCHPCTAMPTPLIRAAAGAHWCIELRVQCGQPPRTMFVLAPLLISP